MKIDYSKDKLLTEFSMKTLQDRYMIPGEASPQEAFARAATAFSDDEDHAQDCMIMQVIYGLCLQLLCYQMEEQKEVCLSLVF